MYSSASHHLSASNPGCPGTKRCTPPPGLYALLSPDLPAPGLCDPALPLYPLPPADEPPMAWDGPFDPGYGPRPAAPDREASPDREACQRAEEHLEQLVFGCEAGNALTLRLARLLAWLKARDLAPLGYSSFTAMARELAPWHDSWMRALVRLADSPLHMVKAAVWSGLVSLTEAVRAPGHLDPEDQEQWLADPLLRALPRQATDNGATPGGATPGGTTPIMLTPEETRLATRARRLARLCIGQNVSDVAADRFILEAWRSDRDPADILREAREPPPPPEPSGAAWPERGDPADPIAGPWREPESTEAALQELARLQALHQDRVASLGRTYRAMVEEKLYEHLGADTMNELVSEHLRGLTTARSLQRYAEVSRAVEDPVVQGAVDAGLSVPRAMDLVKRAHPAHMTTWMQVAPRLGSLELDRALDFASDPDLEPHVLSSYLEAMVRAPQATDKVALPAVQDPPASRATEMVHPDLPEAWRWFVENVRPDPQRGFGKVKERDRFTCQNPECGKPTLRVQAHHIVFRQHGGADDPENGVALCPSCHLRLVHPGHVNLERVPGGILWTYPERRVFVMC